MIEVEKLKQKILDLAIRGKLVPQNQNDEPASVLIEKIKKEKEQLVKQGKIKASKNDSYIYKGSDNCYYEKIGDEVRCIDDEIPFEIPCGWEWSRLRNLLSIFGRIGFRGYNKKDIVKEGLGAISISPSNISGINFNFEKCTYISWEKYYESPEIMIENGDIILVKTGSSYGKCAIVNYLPEKATINPQSVVLKNVLIEKKYLLYVLNSPLAKKQYEEFVIGAAIPTFSQEKLSNFLIPIPPLEEQKMIVCKIEKMYPLLESIYTNETTIRVLIEKAKQKILDSFFGENSSYKSYYKNYIPLSDLFESISTVGMEVKNRDVSKMGKYPVVGQGKELVDGYHNDDKKIIKDYPVIVFGDHTRIIKYIDFEFVPGADGTKILKPKVYPKYLYYCCLYASNKIEDRGYNRHFALLRNYLVPNIKDLLKQKEIVNKIDIIYKQLEIMLD